MSRRSARAAAFLPWLLVIVLAGVGAVQCVTLRRQAADAADLRAEVYAVRDDLGDANDALDKQAQRIERIEGKAGPKQAPVEPADKPFDLHVATAATGEQWSTEPAQR